MGHVTHGADKPDRTAFHDFVQPAKGFRPRVGMEKLSNHGRGSGIVV